MLDDQGYRPNVAILLLNQHNKVFWAKRRGQTSWQFPQGGIDPGETAEECLVREIYEEIGLRSEHIQVLGKTQSWLYYDVPNEFIRAAERGIYRGQKQIWFLLRLLGGDEHISLNRHEKPEFDDWCWCDYWFPVDQVIEFKRPVYAQALNELAPLVFLADSPDSAETFSQTPSTESNPDFVR